MQDATSVLKEILKGGTVSYQAIFAKSLKNVPAAVFLSQAYFWQENAMYRKADEHREFDGLEYFSKTAVDWYEATGMSDEQQKTARERLVSVGILTEIKAGIPARLWFRIDLNAIVSVVTSFLNSRNQVSVKPGNSMTENPETGIGETRKQYDGKPGNTYIESNREFFESNNDSNKKENSDFVFDGPSVPVVEVTVFEPPRVEVFPLEEDTKKEKKLKGRAPRKNLEPEQFTDRDVAKYLETKEQVFWAEILNEGIWSEYLDHRKSLGASPYKTAKTTALQVEHFYNCANGNIDTARRVLNQSIRGSKKPWIDLFPIRQEFKNGNNGTNGIGQNADYKDSFFFRGVTDFS
jgi:hypothetical protein